ncbi:MAG TPA: HDOD domain-containing protein [Bryobacteraceae bacterium]|nr:HDOD domain-containing protein [Bryobacteraceae bacterium]
MQTCDSVLPEALKNVPPFPPVAARLLSLLASPDVEVAEVAELIRSDATLSARMLRCINSAAFGLGRQISDVRQAVALLGFDRTRQITAMCATAAFRGTRNSAELKTCWQHSMATAILSNEIATSCDAFTKIAFTAGVLHDLGRLGLIVAYPSRYANAVRGANGRCVDFLDFEREQFGFDHAEAGRLLAETWELPEEFRIVAGRHHDPCEGTEVDLLRIVHVGCRLADALGYGMAPPREENGMSGILEKLPERARKRMQRTEEELRAEIEERIHTII